MADLRITNIERKRPVKIRVNGKEIAAYHGETLLAALMASGYKFFKKSSIMEEPRGALCGMGVCYECLVTLNGIPGVRACMEEVEENMEIELDDSA
jgi:sarcosine oxidase subunit alpha